MNKMIVLTMASALILPPLYLYADDAHHPEEQGVKEEVQRQGKAPQEEMMEKMSDHMQKMMRQMDEIHKTDDPARREKLLQEHMQSMHEGMGMMRGMGGGMMQGMMGRGGSGGMMMGKGMRQGGGKMDCGDLEMRHQHMERRMDMMQMMMEQMMQHRRAERSYQ